MNEKILVVEDESHIRSFINLNLTFADFQVIEASSGEEALKKCINENPDFIVLDIMLPDIDGYEVCQKIREQNLAVPIIMLTAKGQDMDKIMGLDLGADDYMVKPFNPSELISRIRAILRRTKLIHNVNSETNNLTCNNLILDINSQRFYKDNQEIPLTHREFSIMEVFMKNKGKALTRDEILNFAWGENFYGDYKTIDVHVRKLRGKIEDDSSMPKYIQTVWGHGYRFVSE